MTEQETNDWIKHIHDMRLEALRLAVVTRPGYNGATIVDLAAIYADFIIDAKMPEKENTDGE